MNRGNHSGTQFPDVSHATVDGKPATDVLDSTWAQVCVIALVEAVLTVF